MKYAVCKKSKAKILIILLMVIILIGVVRLGEDGIWSAIDSSKQALAGYPPQISAEYGILIDGQTGEVMYKKNSDQKAYPASITKIMTALVVLDKVRELEGDLDTRVKIPEVAVGTEGSSIYLTVGEELVIRDLLYGLMLRSGNDAAVALAEIMGPGQEEFVVAMNKKAVEIGCKRTNFMNPNGLFNENHYTTAEDMALISMEAMKNTDFREIAASKNHRADREPDKFCEFYNKNKVVNQYEGGNGIKIGFTEKSGRTLVASAKRGESELICVVMNAPSWFNDSYRLMNFGFEKKGVKEKMEETNE